MKRTKRIGPNIDPWGTPDRTGLEDDLMPSNYLRLRCVLFHRGSSLRISINYHQFHIHISINEELSRD